MWPTPGFQNVETNLTVGARLKDTGCLQRGQNKDVTVESSGRTDDINQPEAMTKREKNKE